MTEIRPTQTPSENRPPGGTMPPPEKEHSLYPSARQGGPEGPAERRGSTAQLISRLASDIGLLLRKEVALARAELSEKVAQVRTGTAELGTGAIVTHAGVLVLLLAAVLGLNAWVEALWLSALIVGGVVTLAGVALLGRGRSNLAARHLTPDRTLHSLRRDADLAREGTRR